jgi:RND superfamily putative drug exporter
VLRRLAGVVLRHRTSVLVAWLALTAFGGFAAPRAVNRLLTTFSIPGSSAYKANQQVVHAFGNGDQQPLVVVFHDSNADVTRAPWVQRALARA